MLWVGGSTRGECVLCRAGTGALGRFCCVCEPVSDFRCTYTTHICSLYGLQPSSIHLHCVCRCQYDLQIVLFVTSCNSTRLSFSRACNLSCSCVIGKVHFAQYTICDALCALSAVYLCCVFCTLCVVYLCCVQVGGRGIRRVMADRSCRSRVLSN